MNDSLPTKPVKHQSFDKLGQFLEACRAPDMDLIELIAKQNWYKLVKNKDDFIFLLKEFSQDGLKPYYADLLTVLFSNVALIRNLFVKNPNKLLNPLLDFMSATSKEWNFEKQMFENFFIDFLFKKNIDHSDLTNFEFFIDDAEELDILIKAFPIYQQNIIETIFENPSLYSHLFYNQQTNEYDYQICIDLMQRNPAIKNYIFDSYIKNIHTLAQYLWFDKKEVVKLFLESFTQEQQVKLLHAMLSDSKIFNDIDNYAYAAIESLEFSYKTIDDQSVTISGKTLFYDYKKLHHYYETDVIKHALFADEKLHTPRKTYFVKIYLLEALINDLNKRKIKQAEVDECLNIITIFYRQNPNWQQDKYLVETLKSLVNHLGLRSSVAGLKHLTFFNIISTNRNGDIPEQKLPYELQQTLIQVEDKEKNKRELIANQETLKKIKYAFEKKNFVEGLALAEKIPIDTPSRHYHNTALHYGCMYGDAATVNKLIGMGANVLEISTNENYIHENFNKEEDYEEEMYENILHIAARFKNLAAIETICQNTPQDKLQKIINQKDELDRTPLIIALCKKDYLMAKILLQNGATNTGDYKNKNPLQLAKSYLKRHPDNEALQQIVSDMEKVFKTGVNTTTPGVQYFQTVTNPSSQQDSNQPISNPENGSNTNTMK